MGKKWVPYGAKLMVGQSRLIFFACFQFVPPLLQIMPGSPNIGFELVGPPGLGKSTAARWAVSGWGGDPTRLAGFLETWATTLAALERTMRWHSNSLLGLDELNLLGSLDDREVRRLLETAVFRLCYGAEKAIYGAPKPPTFDRLCWLSTSNIGVSAALVGFAPDVAAAAAQRLLSIPAEASEFGIFDRLAPGFSTSNAMIQFAGSTSDRFFGTAIPVFLMHLVPARRQNEPNLRTAIEQWIKSFLDHADINRNDGPSVRIATPFGLTFAAGKLAQHWGALPQELRIGEAIMKCYRAHLSQAPALLGHGARVISGAAPEARSALDRIIGYIRQHRGQLIDLRAGKLDMDDTTFAETPGFLKPVSGGRLELLISPTRMHRIPGYLRLMQELRDQGHARVERGDQSKLTTKALIRRNQPADRVYCIRLPSGVMA